MDDATFAAILARIATGEATYKAIKALGAVRDRFYERVGTDPESQDRYARAKDGGLEAWSDDTVELTDETPPMVATGFGMRVDTGWVAWRKLQVENRHWHLEKLRPKRYGHKTLIGNDPDNPIPPLVVIGATDGGNGKD